MSLSDKQDVESPPDGFGCGNVGGNSYGCGWGDLGGGGCGCGLGFSFLGEDRGDGPGYRYSDAGIHEPYYLTKPFLSGLAMSGPAFDDLIRWSVRDEFV